MSERALNKAIWWLPIALVLGAACVGGQTGDGEPADQDHFGDPTNNGGEGGAECEYETEVVADLDARGELGFAPRQAIERTTGSFATSLRWQSSPQLQIGPESGVSALTIEVEHDGREVRIRRPVMRTDGGDGREGEVLIDTGGFDACPVAYEIDVQLAFRSEGGAFDESFETTLVATAPDVATFRQPIDHEALAGSFEVLGTQPPGGVVKQVYIAGTLSPLGSYGSVDGVLEYTTPGDGDTPGAVSDVAVGGGGLIAIWPADEACDRDFGAGLAVALDDDLGGHSLAEAVASVDALFPRALSWQVPLAPAQSPTPMPADPDADPLPDGEPEPNPAGGGQASFEEVSQAMLSLSLEPAEAGCARLENGRWRIALPVAVQASTDDGTWQARYEGELAAVSGADGLAQVSVRAGVDNVPIESFASDAGISGVDLAGYDYGRADLFIEADRGEGRLEVHGADVADCVENPPEPIRDEDGNIVGAPGCRGTDFFTVLRGSF